MTSETTTRVSTGVYETKIPNWLPLTLGIPYLLAGALGIFVTLGVVPGAKHAATTIPAAVGWSILCTLFGLFGLAFIVLDIVLRMGDLDIRVSLRKAAWHGRDDPAAPDAQG